jgi:ribosomal protein S18 acetylase RimI-like enzyme
LPEQWSLFFVMEIRHVTPEDVPSICDWWQDRTPQNVQELVDRAVRLQECQRGAGFVALCDHIPCGFAMLTYWVHVAEISDLLVIPAYRGQGIGTRIIKNLLNTAHTAGYPTIEIGVLAKNTRARHLYERLGFKPVRTIQHRVAHGYDDIVYLLRSIQ